MTTPWSCGSRTAIWCSTTDLEGERARRVRPADPLPARVRVGVGALVDRGPHRPTARRRLLLRVLRVGAAGDHGDVHRQPGGAVADDGRLPVVERVPRDGRPRRSTRVDVATGLAIYFSARTAIGALGVAAVLALFDETRTWGLLARRSRRRPLTGAAFAVPLAAWTATRRPTTRSRRSCASGSSRCSCSAARSTRSTSSRLAAGRRLGDAAVARRRAVPRRVLGGLGAGAAAPRGGARRVRRRRVARVPGDVPQAVADVSVVDARPRRAITRIVPDVLLDVRRPQRLIERSAMVYRRHWMVIFSGFFEPLFYLLSIRSGCRSWSATSRSAGGRSRTTSSSPRR